MRTLISVIIIINLIVMVVTPCFAEGTYQEEFKAKLSRGLRNILSAPAEIPVAVAEETEDSRMVWYDSLEGIFRGVGKSVVRLLSGLYDVLVASIPDAKTFPPDPETLGNPITEEQKS